MHVPEIPVAGAGIVFPYQRAGHTRKHEPAEAAVATLVLYHVEGHDCAQKPASVGVAATAYLPEGQVRSPLQSASRPRLVALLRDVTISRLS